jgi:multiple sugar transport system ATP-binding protein
MLQRSIVDLSGGEQQRVALARVMARDADAYLFDEPLANLDPKLRFQARRDILAMHRRKGKPSLYVTHDQAEAIAMADRIGIMARSHLQQVGTVDDLLHEPANMFVAAFMGTPPMNLVPAAVDRSSGMVRVRADGLSVVLPGAWARAVDRLRDGQVMLGIRPDGLAPGGAEGHDNVVSGEVRNVEPLIGETILNLRTAGGLALAAQYEDLGDTFINAGEVAHLAIDPERIRLFDPETELALAR